MKCDRRWWNDGRLELEGEETSVRYWGGKRGWGFEWPFWRWWLLSDAADAFRAQRERLCTKTGIKLSRFGGRGMWSMDW